MLGAKGAGADAREGDDERPKSPTAPPSIVLPKGGGAVRGIGEKFTANPVTGTGSETLPIATSPGRAGFGPQLSLAYDSGAGQGPFGLGWTLRLPQITRKTDKGLPRYLDAEESDIYILSGSEDLVPETGADGALRADTTTAPGYAIQRYRPRIEGLFARIERWTRADGDIHWRSLAPDNTLTVYGGDARSRIADPLDARRIFTWLACEVRDDKGNAVIYTYKAEDGAGVDLGAAHEQTRGAAADVRRTANRYLARVRYGNRVPLLDGAGARPRLVSDAQIDAADWMFEVVLDYGEYDAAAPTPHDAGVWATRLDPSSSYRAGFEVRTRRLCQRVLMFHHFAGEPDVGADCLVRSTDFAYAPDPVVTTLASVTQRGYVRQDAGYLVRSLPAVAYEYTAAVIQDAIAEVDAASLANLPVGLDAAYRWADLHGEGIPGLLAEQGDAWFYTRNVSPISARPVELEPTARVALQPNLSLASGAQLSDLSGAGVPDLVVFGGPTPGFYQHDAGEGWLPFRAFASHVNRDVRGRDTRLVDLDGDGRADVLVTDQDALRWHPSRGEAGFGSELRVSHPLDEALGPRLVFADGTDSIYLADLSGDGLADLVRVRNGEVSYWPNLGYGQFGARVTMDGSPRFDSDDQFDQRRIRLADIDGSGTADLIYLHRSGPRIYTNQAGNAWSAPRVLASFPPIDNVGDVQVTDLLGNGTMCLVWSSPLPGAGARRVRYVDLMGGHKPHLLVRRTNGLGAETRIDYVTSTKFYLQDRRAGRPWATKLPFPVQVVERVVTTDETSGNRFTTRYAYRDGYFDGVEREFRGFGRVDQWDSEELATLGDGTLPPATNLDGASNVPPVLTRTWFHLGIRTPDAAVPAGLGADEEREACRALKGSMLRQEVYALDGTPRAALPYTVVEQSFTVERLQAASPTARHGVFFTHAREVVTTHTERDAAEPRVQHALTLEVDAFGNTLRALAIAYGRATPATDPALSADDHAAQARTLVTYTERAFTVPVSAPDAVRNPLTAETRTYELTGFAPEAGPRFSYAEWTRNAFALLGTAAEVPFEQAPGGGPTRRLVAHTRTLYRRDDLTALSLLGTAEAHALPGETYQLALTPGLLAQVMPALAAPAAVLESTAADGGGYVAQDGAWWIPSGRAYYGAAGTTAAQELAAARAHFYQPRRFVDPFAHETAADYAYDLLVTRTVDALANETTAAYDYRTLQPRLVTDANGNRSAAAFDAHGLVVATARMGKATEARGDLLEGFVADPPLAALQGFVADPAGTAAALLGKATTRVVYDLERFARTGQPPFAATLARETHWADAGGPTSRIQIAFAYSDGFGREVQKKLQATPGDAPARGPAIAAGGDLAPGALVRDVHGAPVLAPTAARWVGSGRVVYNNKGKPVRAYEPFFSSTPLYEPERDLTDTGASPVQFYDPLSRVVATLHPDQTYEKVVIGAWSTTTHDANDTVLADPHTDADVGGHVAAYLAAHPWQTWYAQRSAGALGAAELAAAQQTAVHADTPSTAYRDALDRTAVTVAHNRYVRGGITIEEALVARTEHDIVGNQRAVGDALGRVAMRYDHDLAKRPLHTASMDAGERWTLPTVGGDPLRAWDSRGFARRHAYDELRRPTHRYVAEGAGAGRLAERTIYGEAQGSAANHRTRVYQRWDGAGTETAAAYDFKGNVTELARALLPDYATAVDWSLAPAATGGPYTTRTTYDALDRVATQTTPDASVHHPVYDPQNRLAAVDVNLRGAAAATHVVTSIDYDAKGRRTAVAYGNGAASTYTYDPHTLRLVRLTTARPGAADATAAQIFAGTAVQDLAYTYDPAGNIVRAADSALQTVFFAGAQVAPVCTYTYDAVYRLIEATGREHVAQGALDPAPASENNRDLPFVGLAHPNDLQALRTYTERYEYDLGGNPTALRHIVGGGGWARTYDYAEASLLEPALASNRITRTTIGARVEPLAYDAHGNTTALPPIATLDWDEADRLHHADLGGGGRAYYVYDHTGRRVRKVIERGGVPRSERVYVGAFEVYRDLAADGTATLERETLHVLDDKQRIALVETQTVAASVRLANPAPLVRYQLANHLGSACVELDDGGALIGYEEYHPYGTTAFQAGRSAAETSLKRYRYSGKERDEETGLAYHEQRYYAPWLLRWASADPTGIADGPNVFAYARGNPVRFTDPHGTDCGADPRTCTLSPPPPPEPAPSAGQPIDTGGATPAAPTTDPPRNAFTLRELGTSLVRSYRHTLSLPTVSLPASGYDYSTDRNGVPRVGDALSLSASVLFGDNPELKVNLLGFAGDAWRAAAPALVFGGATAAGGLALATANREYRPYSLLASLLPSVVPPLYIDFHNPIPRGEGLRITGVGFDVRTSNPINPRGLAPESGMPVGLAGSLRLFGDLIGLPYAVSVAGNARFLTDQQLFRGQLQVGVDLRAIAIPIGSYQLSLDLTARFNYFNQADIGPAPRTPSPAIPNEQAVGFQLRFGPPVERK